MTVKFKKLSEQAVVPVRTKDSGAGFNLTVAGASTEANQRGQIIIVYHSNIAVDVPAGYEAVIRPVNSIANKTLRMCDAPSVATSGDEAVARFVVTTDVIPSIYENGEVFAQIVFHKIEDVELEEIQDTSAASGSQSLPENEGEPTNSETAPEQAAGEVNAPEEA